MALTVRPVIGAVVRERTARDIARERRSTPRKERSKPGFAIDTVLVDLPRIRGASYLGPSLAWSFPDGTIEQSRRTAAPRHAPEVGRSYWLVGDTVFAVSDLNVTPSDVLALLHTQKQRRAATLRRAHASLEPPPYPIGTHDLPAHFSQA